MHKKTTTAERATTWSSSTAKCNRRGSRVGADHTQKVGRPRCSSNACFTLAGKNHGARRCLMGCRVRQLSASPRRRDGMGRPSRATYSRTELMHCASAQRPRRGQPQRVRLKTCAPKACALHLGAGPTATHCSRHAGSRARSRALHWRSRRLARAPHAYHRQRRQCTPRELRVGALN
eukprot:scaffold156046_cov29-Tisochrysis_lutea.AAC.1